MTKSIQELLPDNRCFGCGTLNPAGLGVKSYVEGDEVVCRFQPSPVHMAGPVDVVYGGIIASVIDCHSVCTAIADAYRAEGRPIGSEPRLWAVTANLNVTYLAPTPIAEPMVLRARVREVKGRKRVVDCTLTSGGKECARAEVLAVQVAEGWKAGA